ncbi:unnamed protein product [Leptidea sinapis]|uniref:Uncharacterized protein n=1 Tax=Leptidea sinapis TaxID=189913 RepID=A0A5E4PST8_9NEOP|nr:unnamed protein product [Leptidea sinapis]
MNCRVRGVEHGFNIMTAMAPELGRLAHRDDDISKGTRGCATLSRRAGNVARGGTPRGATSHSPSPARDSPKAASVTFDGRTYGCLMPSDVDVGARATRL